MVRRVLSVLALLPLLLPPGLCVCHTPTAACTAGHVDGNGEAPLAHLCLGHDYDGHHHDGSDSSNGPHRHAPGCPALQGLDHWLADPGTKGQGTAPGLVGLVVPLVAAALPAFAPVPSPLSGSRDEAVPLYLTLRTLRI
jgi:hypothetical protein